MGDFIDVAVLPTGGAEVQGVEQQPHKLSGGDGGFDRTGLT